jgi:hypothetical protein
MTTQTIANITTRCKRCLKVVTVLNPIYLAAVIKHGRGYCTKCRAEIAKGGKNNERN